MTQEGGLPIMSLWLICKRISHYDFQLAPPPSITPGSLTNLLIHPLSAFVFPRVVDFVREWVGGTATVPAAPGSHRSLALLGPGAVLFCAAIHLPTP